MIRIRNIPVALAVLTGVISLAQALRTCERFDPAGELYFYADSISAGSMRGTYTFTGAVVNVGKHGISQHGFCWSKSEDPDVDRDTSTRLGALDAPREFSSTVSGLLVNTRYYVRAYATTDAGTEYSKELSFSTPPADLPVVTTLSVSNIGPDSAMSGGHITDDGGSPVSARGVCWSTSPDPTTSNGRTEDGSGTGSFSSAITGLEPNTEYFVRAYATNGQGTAYGNEISFTTLRAGETVIDYDGNIYGTIRIGNQVWMSENLRVIHNADGSAIPFVEGSTAWDDLGHNDRAYCWYQNDTSLAEPYGALYTWAAAMNIEESSDENPSGVQGVCPSGWHLPSDSEWKELEIFLGMSLEEIDKELFRGTDEGGKLKESGTLHWSEPNSGATNESGFTALPAGLRSSTAVFNWLGVEAYFWSSTQDFGVDAWIRRLAHTDARISRYGNTRYSGLSVRCVKDPGSISLPSVITTAATSVTDSSALSGGEVTSDGGAAVTARGVCWNTAGTPTVSDSCTADGTGTGSFISSLTGLDCNTTYYIRAYATNSAGTAYGEQEEFTTDECTSVSPPSVTTATLSGITTTSATGGGNVTDDGGGTVTERGVCWSESPDPATDDEKVVSGAGPGTFISNIGGLTRGTKYYVKAYATNEAGTGYGDEVSFTTLDYPAVTTTAIGALTETSAEVSGEVTSDGGDPVTARGICWSTDPEPTISDNTVPEGAGTGSFTSEISGLSIFTRYYVRAYATNGVGTAYGEELSFRTKWNNAPVTDYDGNVYNTVGIGDQVWLARNLSATHYSDGTAIPLVENTSGWEALNFDDQAYCWYENNIGNINTYGALYTWAAAARGDSSKLNPSGLQGACPDGYHLPSDEEWKDLEVALGMSSAEADLIGRRGTDEGGKLKETGNEHWGGENIGATNESGFTGLGSGVRDFDGNFNFLGYVAPLWSSTQYSDSQAWIRALNYDDAKITRNPYTKSNGYAVRCVGD